MVNAGQKDQAKSGKDGGLLDEAGVNLHKNMSRIRGPEAGKRRP
jgi:hypothetical protein